VIPATTKALFRHTRHVEDLSNNTAHHTILCFPFTVKAASEVLLHDCQVSGWIADQLTPTLGSDIQLQYLSQANERSAGAA
jgi:hypothetical protein